MVGGDHALGRTLRDGQGRAFTNQFELAGVAVDVRDFKEARALFQKGLSRCDAKDPVTAPACPGFVLGTQWHLEWETTRRPDSLALLSAFGDAVARYAEGKTGR